MDGTELLNEMKVLISERKEYLAEAKHHQKQASEFYNALFFVAVSLKELDQGLDDMIYDRAIQPTLEELQEMVTKIYDKVNEHIPVVTASYDEVR